MDREKTKVTVDLYADAIDELKGFSGTNKYAHILREIVDIGIHFYKQGARVSQSVVMNTTNKKEKRKDASLEGILE